MYKNESNTWRQIGSDIDGDGNTYYFGISVSLSENGNRDNGWASGHVLVFENKSDVWTQIGNNIIEERDNDQSGITLSLSGDGTILAVGAYLNNGNGTDSGHVRFYQNISGTWTKIGDDIDGENSHDGSGYSVSISSNGNIVAIGAPLNDARGENSGHVRVYDLSETTLAATSFGQDLFSYYPNPVSNELILNLTSGSELK
ncbi:hypothetical protein [Algibacter sp. Ld11]|uniref:hypothetical protein n=1 Tax=Algibacter sp. Ld11 TaxID=649150 RepID=UPI00386C4BAB